MSVKGDPQNSGNMLPSRPSTRLHAPPGGQSSLSLSWDSPPKAKEVKRAAEAAPLPQGGGQSSNAFANGANQNCEWHLLSFFILATIGGNVLTDRPTTRLHAPPGGKSSITIG